MTGLFNKEAGLAIANADDVEEGTNYLRAFRLVGDNLRSASGLPISVRLLCEAHRLLLDGAWGASKQPGELRRSQNWMGGTRPGRARTAPLVRVALVHAQFETIHPFLDGDGRIGRLLIAALLEHWGCCLSRWCT